MNTKSVIFTPGPQKVEGILDKERAVFHRSYEMQNLIAELVAEMKTYFKKQHAYLYPIPGTDVIDLFIRSVDKKQQKCAGLINTGYWAHNIANVLEGNNIKVNEYARDIFNKSEAELVEIFSQEPATVFYAIASETSTGEFFNYKNIYKALKKTGKYLFMDAISLPVFYFEGNDKYNFDADFTIYSSAKTFHAMPGFNFIVTDIDVATEPLFSNASYSSLKLYADFLKKNQFPNTINTLLFMDFKKCFEYTIFNIPQIKAKIKNLREHLLQKLNDKEIIYLNQEHDAVTNLMALKLPDYMVSDEFMKFTEAQNLFVGRDLMGQNSIRVCFNSYNTIAEVDFLIKLIKDFKKLV
ncbi:hypothetical protein SCLARK_001461 [Spiroplasma clarkii]|uniref:aminotransferase class V-fold PLP-dependent enzyme n=1 Tax=Spiroplasma clarkii TaxID=2139 RepID=UPI000B571BEF|nr:aminotransferase class V-fold PLP-dependent enzyme [Spiroplasma clarkii]ARU91978.1 hypothetical protein SCLARK_001461 [Spiroplasma clarkii]